MNLVRFSPEDREQVETLTACRRKKLALLSQHLSLGGKGLFGLP